MKSNYSVDFSLKKWTLNTIYGWLLGFVVIINLAFASDALGIGNSQFFVGTGIATGVGYMQNRIMRSRLKIGWSWMWMTILGMTISFVFFDFGQNISNIIPAFNLQLSVAVGGIIVGVLQYLVLKANSINGSYWWIFVSSIGWASAGLVVGLVDYLKDYISIGPLVLVLNLLLLTIFSSLVLGLITGVGFMKILKNDS